MFVTTKISCKKGFLSNRVVNYWNKLPAEVRGVETVLQFKHNLEIFKKNYRSSSFGNYWELSEEVFSRINDSCRQEYVSYLVDNPDVMKRRNITCS